MFNNALTYNLPDSDIYFMSETLLKIFNTKFVSSEWDLGETGNRNNNDSMESVSGKKRKASSIGNGGSPVLTPPKTETPMKGEALPPRSTPQQHHVSQAQTPITPVPYKPDVTPKSKPVPAPSPPPHEMTFEEKKDLGEKMNRLNPHQLAKVVHIIHNSKPDAANKSAESDDIEIDMNDLDQATLHQLEKYVNDCLDINQDRGDRISKKHKKMKHKKDE